MPTPTHRNPPTANARRTDTAPLDPRGPWPRTDALETWTSAARLARIDHVLRQRLVSVTAVFEDIFDPHNVAACLRTADGFGLHDVHLVTNRYGARLHSTVAKSADRWLDIHHHATTAACIAALQADGFRLWVSDLTADRTLDQVPVTGRIAIVVGNAANGVSAEIAAAADERYVLPMWGMVQSFNLSVALGLSLGTVVPQRRAQLGGHGDMDLERMWRARRRWLEHGLDHAELLRQDAGDTDDDPRPPTVQWERAP
ncbi:MAG: TrmH family RNA methyltransferase [Myxococcales bacterium]|nr:TrmH family RNA methyltransferase [Myxococcales bacterium]